MYVKTMVFDVEDWADFVFGVNKRQLCELFF